MKISIFKTKTTKMKQCKGFPYFSDLVIEHYTLLDKFNVLFQRNLALYSDMQVKRNIRNGIAGDVEIF